MLRATLVPGEIPEKVPLYLNLQGWLVYRGAGQGYMESVNDSDKLLTAYRKAIHDYPADLYYDTGGFAFMGFSRLLGSDDYYLNEEKYSLNFKDISYLSEDSDYQWLIKDPQSFLWNRFYRQKFKNLNNGRDAETIREYLELSATHFEKVAAMKRDVESETGSLFLSDVPMYQPAFDYLFQYIIGMKGISMAMRRKKDLLLDALDSFEGLFNHYMDVMTPPLGNEMPFQNQICLLGQTITNPKQFELFIWRHLGSKIRRMTENGGRFYFMVEGAGSTLLDYLSEIPDGACALHVESDPLDSLMERFGNKFAYVGGMPVALLGSSPPEVCAGYTRDILEKYGRSGNFIFSTDKGIVFEADARCDSLKAMCEEVGSFRL
ncbi:MAG: hypothetical protein IJT62_00630 [Oscillospiraceae bacterium]|nr:hypothetical protein [Oscillospiraceae bacterium]